MFLCVLCYNVVNSASFGVFICSDKRGFLLHVYMVLYATLWLKSLFVVVQSYF